MRVINSLTRVRPSTLLVYALFILGFYAIIKPVWRVDSDYFPAQGQIEQVGTDFSGNLYVWINFVDGRGQGGVKWEVLESGVPKFNVSPAVTNLLCKFDPSDKQLICHQI